MKCEKVPNVIFIDLSIYNASCELKYAAEGFKQASIDKVKKTEILDFDNRIENRIEGNDNRIESNPPWQFTALLSIMSISISFLDPTVW